jgi:hypothetical protein
MAASTLYEVSATGTLAGNAVTKVVRVMAGNCHQALNKANDWLTAQGWTNTVLRAVDLLWDIDVV